MKEWQSPAHTKRECKCHAVTVPKHRKKVLYGKLSQGEKMANKILMGSKETARAKIMAMVTEGNITLKAGALRLGLGSRQAIRIKSAYQAGGEAALTHGSSGKPSNRRTCGKERERELSAYKERYPGFGPEFAAEKLKENGGIAVSGETLRQRLAVAGLWERKRKSRPYRSRRERRPCFGEPVQFDGSRHDWFEGRGKKCCLMNVAGDAAGKTLSVLFEEETAAAAMTLLSCRIKKYGATAHNRPVYASPPVGRLTFCRYWALLRKALIRAAKTS
jgi:transposase